MASCSGASMPILTRRPVPPSSVIKIGPFAKSCASVMLSSTPSAGWITMDSSARRLRTSMSGLRQRALRPGKGLALGGVGEGCSAAHDPEKLLQLVLARIDNVAVHLVRRAASGHEFHERTPALRDSCGQAGLARDARTRQVLPRGAGERAPLVLHVLDAAEQAHFFARALLDIRGR